MLSFKLVLTIKSIITLSWRPLGHLCISFEEPFTANWKSHSQLSDPDFISINTLLTWWWQINFIKPSVPYTKTEEAGGSLPPQWCKRLDASHGMNGTHWPTGSTVLLRPWMLTLFPGISNRYKGRSPLLWPCTGWVNIKLPFLLTVRSTQRDNPNTGNAWPGMPTVRETSGGSDKWTSLADKKEGAEQNWGREVRDTLGGKNHMRQV